LDFPELSFLSFKESSGLDQFQLDLESGMNFENGHFLGFLLHHFWNFLKELLWLGKNWVQKDFNFLPFLDFSKKNFCVVWDLHFLAFLDFNI